MTQVAQEFGVTRVRVHQMLNLFKLDKRIIYYLLKIEDPRESNFWTERKLRKVLKMAPAEQYSEFQRIKLCNQPAQCGRLRA